MEVESRTGQYGPVSEADAGDGRYRWAVLATLFVIMLFNAVDRTILSILGQPIKEEMHLADWQLGLLSGLGFTALYVVCGFPLARLADSRNRVNVISVCAAFWSLMTALCGLSTNFVQLLLFRMGVGIGEAGCMPASHSLIADYFPPNRRTTALAIYGLGLPLGGLVGMVAGGFAMEAWGWRGAFVLVGLPGLAVALLARLVIREPAPGRREAGGPAGPAKALSLIQCARLLWRSRVSRNVLLAMTLSMIFTSPNSVFLAPYMVRRFGLGYGELGVILAVTFMLGSAISTLAGGILAEWAAQRNVRWLLWMPAIGALGCAPLYVAAYAQPTWQGLAIILFAASVVGSTYLAPCYAVLHNGMPASGRAMTTALSQLLLNIVGLGLGPLLCGAMIDVIAGHLFDGSASLGFQAACPGGEAPAGASTSLALACHSAISDATQYMLVAFSAFMIWPAMHLFLAAKNMTSDRYV